MTEILYFAWVRDATGVGSETLTIPHTLTTARDVVGWLALRHPVFGDPSRLCVAVDQVMATLDTPIAGAREIAFFPPVTGG